MPKYEVLLVVESSHYSYVEAEDEDGAVDLAVQRFDNGDPDENAACGWSKVTNTTTKEIK